MQESLLLKNGSELLPRPNYSPNEAIFDGFETVEDDEMDSDLEKALRLSALEQRNLLMDMEHEQQMLEEAIRLSLQDK